MSPAGQQTFTDGSKDEAPSEAISQDDRETASPGRTLGSSVLREVAETALLALVVFLILNGLTGRFQVRGSSMEPTLHNGQYLVVSKLAYWLRPPARGDIVVFHPPTGVSDDYIKRIVGLPGEQVAVRDGEVFVEGVPLEESYVVRRGSYSGTWELGTDEYFVLGDNRESSSDSHTWGTLPGDHIIGKAWVRYWPPTAWGPVDHGTVLKPSLPGQAAP